MTLTLLCDWSSYVCSSDLTTGLPKGVMYTQRSIILHFMAVGLTFGIQEKDCLLHCVPMFHVNAWGAPYGAVALGCKQVLLGREMLNMEKVCRIMSEEKATFTAGVPTIWMMLYDYLEKGGWHDFSSLNKIVSGGSACPPSLMKGLNEKYGFPIMQAYGMTETSPLALAAFPKSDMADYTEDKLMPIKTSAGILAAGIDMKIVNDKDEEIKHDGKEFGELCFRGPWIAKEYYKDERTAEYFKDGWLHTGDIGTIDEEGYVHLVDRTKDIIKSGGEWISSVDLENMIMAHPAVMEAAVIGIPDVKWQERPMACVVKRQGQECNMEELKDFLKGKVKTEWWVPEKFHFMEAIPKTSVGKFNKRELRAMCADGRIKL
jgi:fatty-acyl-CoA synthase